MTCESMAQIRHIKGIKSVEAGYGMNSLGPMYYAAFVPYVSSRTYLKFSPFHATGQQSEIQFTSMGVEASLGINLLKAGEFLYVNARPGLVVSADRLSPGIQVFQSDGSVRTETFQTIKIGGFAGVETEIFITDKLVFILGWNQRFLLNQDKFGRNRHIGYAGIRFNL